MDSGTGSYCKHQYNVGVLDGVGVGILWMNVLRWAVLITFNDDINVLFCMRNPVVINGSSNTLKTIFRIVSGLVPFASLIYTTVQAATCGEKLLSDLIVFVSFYDIVFQLTRANLMINVGAVICLPGPDLLLLISSAIAISYGGQVRALGIAGIVFVCILVCVGCDYTEEKNDLLVKYVGPLILFYGFVYPTILACFITLIVKEHNQWIPRPQTKLEYALLYLRVAFGSGALEVLTVFAQKIYAYLRRSHEEEEEEEEYLDKNLHWWGFDLENPS